MKTLAGRTIQMLREAEGLSRKELSVKLGVDPSTVTRWETEACKVSAIKLQLILEMFPEAVSYLEETNLRSRKRRPKYYQVEGLSERLLYLQRTSEMTQKQFCKKLKCTPSTWWNWCCSTSVPNGFYLREISKVFRVSVDWLLGLKKEKTV